MMTSGFLIIILSILFENTDPVQILSLDTTVLYIISSWRDCASNHTSQFPNQGIRTKEVIAYDSKCTMRKISN